MRLFAILTLTGLLAFCSRAEDVVPAVPDAANPVPAAVVPPSAEPGPAAPVLPEPTVTATNAAPQGGVPAFPSLPPRGPRVRRSLTNGLPSAAVPSNAAVLPLPNGGTNAAATNAIGLAAQQRNAPRTNAPAGLAGTNVVASSLAPTMDGNETFEAGTIQLQGMDLPTFLDIYSKYSGRTVLRAYNLPGPTGMTLKAETDLNRREVVEAMESVLSLNGITMIPMGEKFIKAVPAAQADKEGAEISKLTSKELPDSEQFFTKVVKLKSIKPSEIAPVLAGFSKLPTAVTAIDSNSSLVLRDTASNLKRMLELIEHIDKTPETDFQLEVIPIRYGKVTDIYATMSALISGGGGGAGGGGGGAFSGAQSSRGLGGSNSRSGGGAYGGLNGAGSGGRYGGNYINGGAGGSGGGYGNRSQYGGGGYYPEQVTPPARAVGGGTSAAGNQNSFQNRLNQIVNKAAGGAAENQLLEGANIVPDERSNKLLVFANKRDMVMITNIVAKVDVLLAQVLIEAVILEVKLDDGVKVGVSAVQQPRRIGNEIVGAGGQNNSSDSFGFLRSITNFPAGMPGGMNYYTRIAGDFDVAINAIATDSNIKIVSRPRIQTSHAIPGFFFVGETVPYVTGTTDYGSYAGSGLTSRSSVQERVIGLNLSVTPFITPEGLVVMEIQQQFDQRGADVTIDGNPVPIVNSRQAEATLTVRDKDLIMLGGFISETKSTSKSGVPWLKDIPGIGFLFRSSSTANNRTELMILIKATILATPEAAAIMATTERMQQPGTREAIQDFEESNAKRSKKLDKKAKLKRIDE